MFACCGITSLAAYELVITRSDPALSGFPYSKCVSDETVSRIPVSTHPELVEGPSLKQTANTLDKLKADERSNIVWLAAPASSTPECNESRLAAATNYVATFISFELVQSVCCLL
jgi:hypothetical protein